MRERDRKGTFENRGSIKMRPAANEYGIRPPRLLLVRERDPIDPVGRAGSIKDRINVPAADNVRVDIP